MARVIEQGDVYFFYEPRWDAKRVTGPQDVGRLYLVLSGDQQFGRHCRLLSLESPVLPTIEREGAGAGARLRVEAIGGRPEDMANALASRRIVGATARRRGPIQRPAAEGRYALVEHDGHSDFDYVLELPRVQGPVQRDLGIRPEASYRMGLRSVAEAKPILDPSDMDVADGELILEPEAQTVPQDVRDRLKVQPEGPGTAEIFAELKLKKSTYPLEPLYQGEWR